MLNLEKIWHETLQICPPHLSDVATLPWEIQKSHFSTLLFIYFRVAQKKTSSNCSSAALAVYLLLFSTSSYLHSPSTALGHATGGACALIWACWGSRQWLVAMWAEFQHSMVYYVTEQCQKRLEACINAKRDHSEHLLWHCLPDYPVATHHNRFFSDPRRKTHNQLFPEPKTSEIMQQAFSQMKKFCSSVWWHFQVGWASGLQIVFLWVNVNNHK